MKQNMQNQTISELYSDDKKLKYSINPNDILKSLKNFYGKRYTKEATSKTATAEHFGKISNKKKISNEQIYHCGAGISLEKVAKSINSQTYNKSPGNYDPTAKFKKHFSNELPPILLHSYQSWEKRGTMKVSFDRSHICHK